MRYRTLGATGPRVSALGLGVMPMSEFYGKADPESSVRTIQRALDLGVTLIDTAAAYGAPEHGEAANEELVGRAIKGVRDRVVLATKFGVVRARGTRFVNNSPAYARLAIERSLTRLGVERVDIYYLHRWDRSVPIQDVVGTMAELVKEGKVGHLGLSEVGAQTLRLAHREHPITALQSEYSLLSRHIETDILPTAQELGVGLVAYAPMGRALLAGALRSVDRLHRKDLRRTHPRFRPSSLHGNLSLVDRFAGIARDAGCTPAQLALAWLLDRSPHLVPIPSTSKVRHLEENLRAVDVTLTEDHMRALETAFRPDAVLGERNTPAALALME